MGALIQGDSDRYALPEAVADKSLVAGRLTMHRDGFGFVIPDAKSLSPALKARLTGDIFIPPHLIGNAMHGDLVLVDIVNVRPDGRAEGRIVRPVMRAHPTVVGIFHYGNRGGYVKPIDSKTYAGDFDSRGNGATGVFRVLPDGIGGKGSTTGDTEDTEEEICRSRAGR